MITLDAFLPSDAKVMCEADSDAELRRRFEFPEDFVPSVAHSEAVVSAWNEENRAGTRHTFAIRGDDGELFGGCQIRPKSDRMAHVSYWTYPAHRERGVASAALKMLATRAFEEMRFERLEAHCDPDHTASKRVALRAGFSEVGTRDGRIVYELPK